MDELERATAIALAYGYDEETDSFIDVYVDGTIRLHHEKMLPS